MTRRRSTEKILNPVLPNAGIAIQYRKALNRLIDEMQASYEFHVAAAYRRHQPEMAQDFSPAKELQRALERLGKRWQRRFREAAPRLAKWFLQKVSTRSRSALMNVLKEGGWTVEFKMTPAMRDVVAAAVQENVSLIKSIQEQYHRQVQGLVMRSVQTGRDLEGLTKDLRQRYPITKRRAALISLDQNNKVTAVFTRVRQLEAGIGEAIWMHSHAGKEPRPTHLKNDGNRYRIQDGWFDPDPKVRRRIWPGELINCRCTSRAVVKGFS